MYKITVILQDREVAVRNVSYTTVKDNILIVFTIGDTNQVLGFPLSSILMYSVEDDSEGQV